MLIFLLTGVAFIFTLVLTAIAASFVVFLLVGPHGGVLPASFHKPALFLAWAVVLTAPFISARWMWRCLTKMVANKTPTMS